MDYAIDWDTAKVHLTEKAQLVLTVEVKADPRLVLQGEAEPNPIWRQSFNHMATARRHEWRSRNLHWGTPTVTSDGKITVDPIDSSGSEAELLPGELDDLVKRANEHDAEWERLKTEAQELTDFFRAVR